MDTLELGIEQILIETKEICLTPNTYFCEELDKTTIININLISFLAMAIPIIVIFFMIKVFKSKKC